MGRVRDRPVALVTGASGGLGQALAVELDALGCRVAVHYNSSAAGARAVADKLANDSVHTARVAVGHMLLRRWGRIINVVSPSGLIATAGQTAHSASKAGVIGLTRTLAAECGRRGVTVNALSPGFMVTTMTKDLPATVLDGMRSKSPIPRFGTTEEVARTMPLFLDSDFMTGQVISIDGGISIT